MVDRQNLQPLSVNFDLSQSQNARRDAANENRVEPVYRGGKVVARKPEVFSESMNIDEWIESLKAYLVGTNPNAATDQVQIAQVKSFLSSTAIKRVKHIFKNEVCDWSQLKKWMELAFNRNDLKYEMKLAKFLVSEQALTETRVMNQFAQGIHDRLVRSDVKRYITQHGMNNICSMDVLEAASQVAKDQAVEEQYKHTYR